MGKTKTNERAVLVTTELRGVFFGYLEGTPDTTIVLKRARNCLYWSKDVKGFLGLAASGPSESCRVGPAVPELVLHKVSSITACTPEATKAWESGPWSK